MLIYHAEGGSKIVHGVVHSITVNQQFTERRNGSSKQQKWFKPEAEPVEYVGYALEIIFTRDEADLCLKSETGWMTSLVYTVRTVLSLP